MSSLLVMRRNTALFVPRWLLVETVVSVKCCWLGML